MPVHIRLYLTLSLAFYLLITLLVLSSGPAYAEWVSIGEPGSSGTTIYVDPDTIRRKGNLVKMWVLADFMTTQTLLGDSYSSYRSQNEYDCAEERTRVLAITRFSGNMETGKIVYNDSGESKWTPIPPRSIAQDLWKIACDKQ